MRGIRSTGSKSIEFIRKIQTNTVSASGADELARRALCTMALGLVVDHLDHDLDRRLESAPAHRVSPGAQRPHSDEAKHPHRTDQKSVSS